MKAVSDISKAKVDGQTVAVLEELLAEAKKGNLTSLIYVDAYKDNKIGYGWAGTPNDRMITKMEQLKFGYFYDIEVAEQE